MNKCIRIVCLLLLLATVLYCQAACQTVQVSTESSTQPIASDNSETTPTSEMQPDASETQESTTAESAVSASEPDTSGATSNSEDKPQKPSEPVTQPSAKSNILVAYFSATGNTEPLAQYAASYLGADLYEIKAKVPYTADDLKYYTDCRADREQNDPNCRPAIDGSVSDMQAYDIVLIGYPIWHGQAPKILYTFLESYDFTGKTVLPFCTSASSGIGSSATNLHACAPKANWKEGKRFAIGTDEQTLCAWLDTQAFKNDNKEEANVNIYCGENKLSMKLADNPSAKAFAEVLQNGDVTVTMRDYGNFEKVGELGFSLPQTNTQITTSPGDVILYLGSNVTIYYDVNSWNFTLLGKIPDMTRERMLAFFGGMGETTVRFSLR